MLYVLFLCISSVLVVFEVEDLIVFSNVDQIAFFLVCLLVAF